MNYPDETTDPVKQAVTPPKTGLSAVQARELDLACEKWLKARGLGTQTFADRIKADAQHGIATKGAY